MRRAFKWLLLATALTLALLVVLRACVAVIPARNEQSSTSTDRPMNTGILEIELGEYGHELIERNTLRVRQSSVAGLNFFEVSDIGTGVEPTVRLLHGGHVLEFPQARSVIMDEVKTKEWPIEDITIAIKMPQPPDDAGDLEAVEHYDAAVFALYQDIVQRMKAAGWKRLISLHEPRIEGIETYAFEPGYRTSAVQWDIQPSPDQNHELSFEDWRHMTNTPSWRWHLDGAVVSLGYSRSPRHPGYDVHDTFEINIISDRSQLSGYDPNGNSDLEAGSEDYKAGIPGELAKRRKAEEKAKAAGIPVLTDYVDPSIGGISIPID